MCVNKFPFERKEPFHKGTFLGGGLPKNGTFSKNNDLKVPKLCDFSYISMTNPPIPSWWLKMAKRGVFVAFLLWAVPISRS